MSDRALATLETVSTVSPIEGADQIEVLRVRGWDVVAKRGEFVPGDLCVYIEVDTLVDVSDPRFAFLAPRGVRTDATGVTGHVLKTARLRGAYSQGLVLPVGDFPELAAHASASGRDLASGDDVTALLPVRRWDPPLPAQLSGSVNGPRPSWIPATDEERAENRADLLALSDLTWVATEKLDGTSTTVWVDGTLETPRTGPASWAGVRGVCSRNYDLTYQEGHTQWELALAMGLHDLMASSWPGARVALQGETVGEGIQGNPLKLRGHALVLFTVRVDGREVPRSQWPQWALDAAVPLVPALTFPQSVEQAVGDVESLESVYAPGRPAEGVVWRAVDAADTDGADGRRVRASFKVISRRYLLKHDR